MKIDDSFFVYLIGALAVLLLIVFLLIKAGVAAGSKKTNELLASLLELKNIELERLGFSPEELAEARNRYILKRLNEQKAGGMISVVDYGNQVRALK